MDCTDDHRYLLPIRTPVSGAIVVEVIVEPAQGLALEFDKALDEEAVDTRHHLHQFNFLDDEAAVTSHLLDQLNDALNDETHYARSRHKILAAAAT